MMTFLENPKHGIFLHAEMLTSNMAAWKCLSSLSKDCILSTGNICVTLEFQVLYIADHLNSVSLRLKKLLHKDEKCDLLNPSKHFRFQLQT